MILFVVVYILFKYTPIVSLVLLLVVLLLGSELVPVVGSELVTSHRTDVHGRPAKPVDAVGSIFRASHTDTVVGADSITIGIIGCIGGDNNIVEVSENGQVYVTPVVIIGHIGFILFLINVIVLPIFSTGVVGVYISEAISRIGDTHKHMATSEPSNITILLHIKLDK